MATLFAKKQSQLRKAFHRTGLAEQGWEFSDITQCVFANVQRDARTLLEQRGVLRSREKHVNGTEWVYWAEEPMDNK
jgi:hypothetical protein